MIGVALLSKRVVEVALLLAATVVWQLPAPVSAADDAVRVVNIKGTIDTLTARQIGRAVEDAEAGGSLLVIRLNTPGGLLDATRSIVESVLGAKVPVAVYVSPSGGQAASAGTFITAAGNFAAMAPGTNIGAATPVGAGGEEIPPTLARKIGEDTRAFIRSIAAERGRNAEALEETITLSLSYAAREAVELSVVDFIADDMDDLLAKLHGLTAMTASGEMVLDTKDALVRDVKPTVLESFLGVIANPNLAFLLFVLGGIALLTEFIIPGSIGPGVVGVILLALAFLGFGNLPVNWIAVGLLVFTMVLFYVEIQSPGVTVFGIGGVISMVLGALLLFGGLFSAPDIPEPSFRVSLWMIGTLTGTAAVTWVIFMRLVRSEGGSSSGYISEEEAALESEWGVAASDLAPSGKVWVADEEWTATTDAGDIISEGEYVKVLGVYGSVLKVARIYDESGEEDEA